MTISRFVFRSLAVTAVLLLALPSVVAADKRAFGIEDFYRVLNPGHVDLAPDGKSVVYDLRSTDLARGKSKRDLYRLSTAGGAAQRLTWTDDASESVPVHAPDGKTIAFLAKRDGQEHTQLWSMPTGGGEAHALTDLPFGLAEPLWSPDSRFIAVTASVFPECGVDVDCHAERVTRRDEGELSVHLADELLYRHWNAWSDGTVTHILLVDVGDGTVRDMTPGDREAPMGPLGSYRDFVFSPDGSELCYTRNPDPVEELARSTNADLWVVPVAPADDGSTRGAKNLTAGNGGWDGSPAYSPDGRYLAYRTQSRAYYEADLMQLALYDRKSETRRILAPKLDNNVSRIAWLPGSDGLVFTAALEGSTPLYRLDLDETAPRMIANLAYIDELALSADGGTAWIARRSVGEPKEIWSVELKDGTARRRTQHNAALEREVDIRPAETIWVDSGGKQIHVFIVKPHGFEEGKRYPLILNVHGGPQSMWADSFRGDWQIYPGAGYVVAFANPHGSTGYGQALTEQISGDWGGRVFDDLMRVTDALEQLPYVDRERMGAMGWSYGGYMMNWFQGHTDRFKCLADMMGIFDTQAFYYATEELWFPEWDLGGTPWDSKQYQRWNPAAHAGKFRTPMLIVTGEQDFRVPYTQGLMSFTALRRQGVPARLIVLPGAGHWPGWYEMALYYTAHVDWFQRYLGGAAPPWSVEDFAGNAVFDTETGERIDVK